MSLAGKTLLIMGGNGYVGSAAARHAARLGINTICVSRRGTPTKASGSFGNIKWVKGDAMRPHEFIDELKAADGVFHTIGTLFDTTVTGRKNPGEEGTYEQMNFETAKRVGDAMNELKMNKKIVYMSAASHPPLLKRYLTTKMDAEDYLKNLPNIRATALRPGVVWSQEERAWTVPIRYVLEAENFALRHLMKNLPSSRVKQGLKCLDSGDPVQLDDLALCAIYNAFSTEFDGKALEGEQIQACRRIFERNSFNV